MKRRILCFLLILALVCAAAPTALAADGIQVFVTIAVGGRLELAAERVTARDTDADGTVTVAEVLEAAHAACCPLGTDGFAAEDTQYGLSLIRLWGDEGPAFGYCLNRAAAWSLADPVAPGDLVSAYVYADQTLWSDSFCWFDRGEAAAAPGGTVTLTLSAAGYDENWNSITLPVAGAQLTLDGAATGVCTDAQGIAVLTLPDDAAGEHILSAVSDSMTLVPPVCRLTVGEAAAAAAYIRSAVPTPRYGQLGGEWAVIGLARSGAQAPAGWYDGYLAALEAELRARDGALSARKYTEYARVILALTAMGCDAGDVAGQDLLLPLGDYDRTLAQGVNGPIWALIALDSGDYPMPEGGATRQAYVDCILARMLPEGGWCGLSTAQAADPDLTAMALLALAPYRTEPEVRQAVEAALGQLSALQRSDGGYASYGAANAESCAQVLMALSTLGIAPEDSRFIKNGNTVLDALLAYRLGDGSFAHTPGGAADLMASEQALLALAAVERLENGEAPLYTMTDARTLVGGGVGLPGRDPAVRRCAVLGAVTFPDLEGHASRAAVEALAARGVIDGMGDGTFAPDQTMTRAQFAAIVVRALGLTPAEGNAFVDVPSGTWYAPYVGTAYAFGLVNGRGAGRFDPTGTITRQEAAVMVARAAALCGLDTACDAAQTRDLLAPFADYTRTADWAAPALAFCYREHILDASELYARPVEPVLRCEVAGMLYRLLESARLLSY